MSNVLDYIINISGNATRVARDLQKELLKASEAFRNAGKSSSAVNGYAKPLNDIKYSYSDLRSRVERYKTARDKSFSTDHIRRYNQMIERTESQMASLTRQTETCADKAEKADGVFGKFGGAAKIGLLSAGLYKLGQQALQFGTESVQSSAQVEKYSVTLRTMLGNAAAARDRMAEYQDIARITPFQFNEVVEAGNQLQAIGRYSRSNLTMLGDLAAASGKSMDQVMGAYAKLATGQKGEGVNMFRDLLISSQDWAEATGKGMSKNGEMLATTEEMIAALPKLMQTKGFFGMMQQQSKTTEGQISNLKDSVFALQVSVGDILKPAVNDAVGVMGEWVNSINKWVQIPTAQKIAEEKAQLNALVNSITDVNVPEAVRLDLMQQLKSEYPEFLKGIDQESLKNDELLGKLKEVNKEYEAKIRLAGLADYKNSELEKLNELRSDLARLSVAKDAESSILENERILKSFGVAAVYDTSSGAVLQSFERSASVKYEALQGNTDEQLLKYNRAYNEWKASLRMKDANSGMFEGFDVRGAYNTAKESYDKQLAFVNLINDRYSQLSKDEGVDLTADKPITSGGFNSPANNDNADMGQPQPSVPSIDQSIDTITGGGRNVKNITISIDKLIETVNNEFRNGEGVAEGDDFLQKLSAALQMVVNDVNYS